MKTKNLSTLKIHKLSQAQYDKAVEDGSIDEQALYLTPDEEIDFSKYALASHEHDGYMAKSDPVGTGSFSMNRKSGTTVGEYSHTEGYNNTASGYRSHAEGIDTTASGANSHAEGASTKASGYISHAEGNRTEASDQFAHAEGWETFASGVASHSEGGLSSTASGQYSHAEGGGTKASGHGSHAEGSDTQALTSNSHAEGESTVVTSDTSVTATSSSDETAGENGHAEGYGTVVSGFAAHAEGNGNLASGTYSHAEGGETVASGDGSHAEGASTEASGAGSHAEGGETVASGGFSHAEGISTTASGLISHSEGSSTTASGSCSHAEGIGSTASGNYSHAAGYYTTAQNYQYVIGKYNKVTTAPTSLSDKTTTAGLFIVGVGTNATTLSNGFRINPAGKPYALSSLSSSGADYAEYFEWVDGNPTDEDRRGRFVTLDGEKIRYATAEDDYILGIVSAEPAVIGDIQSEAWRDMYLRDIYGERVIEVVEVEESVDEFGGIIPAHVERRWVLNPEYNAEEEYVSREERCEWDAVGIVGKLVCVDDGSCVVNGYCYPGVNGIAVASEVKTAYRVMERLDETHVRVFIK